MTDAADKLEVVRHDRGFIVRGSAAAILGFSSILRSLSRKHTGAFAQVAGLTLVVALEPRSEIPGRVCLPPDAWNIAASKFAEVATGREDPLLFFGDCGYKFARPQPDIAVELLGEAVEDRPV